MNSPITKVKRSKRIHQFRKFRGTDSPYDTRRHKAGVDYTRTNKIEVTEEDYEEAFWPNVGDK